MGYFEKLIVVKLQGGLGNQMFQYATARALSDEPVCFDLSFLKYNNVSTDLLTARTFELGIFKSMHLLRINPYLLRLVLNQGKKYKFIKRLLPKSLMHVNVVSDVNITQYKEKRAYGVTIFQGDFQNPDFFLSIREKLLGEFTFPMIPDELANLKAQITGSNAVGIHIRRGDYLKPEFIKVHGVLGKDYYRNAILEISRRVENPVFFIFSDDIEWCKKEMQITNFVPNFVSDKSVPAWVDLLLMSVCKHNVIANSTFSWWGAWLNKNPNKIVISPLNWSANTTLNTGTKIIPQDWIRL
ncbi:alpha-1,2-fucosyltransferase [Pedobacter aquatilis]|uniref:alpha-1,2-fucosyltransferase n=1 Tax=Pedobacter aquatilis TaxID=351343 RepID=UPI0029307C69|nr:alpha-1,2-fucosyltransferase [Pedobacter aquatilis]